MHDYGHWIVPFDFNPSDYVGFVYRIDNNKTGQYYFGKKHFRSVRRKKISGRKNRKVIISESNWKEYTSSSKWLNEDIELLGIDNFTFTILYLHTTKAELNYEEVFQIVNHDCLQDKQSYNCSVPSIRRKLV